MKNDDRKPDAWMPFVIGAYLGDTTHLSTEQHGAYFLLLLAAWKRGANLPNDEAQLAQIAKLTPAKWRAHRGVLLAFWAIEGDVLVQKRQVEEYARAVAFNERQKANGSKGGRPPKANPNETQTKPTGYPRENPRGIPDETPSPSPEASPTGEINPTPDADAPDAVGAFEGQGLAYVEPTPEDRERAKLAAVLIRRGMRCTALTPALVEYHRDGGTAEHLDTIASFPDCAGKAASYALNWARRELVEKAAPVVANPRPLTESRHKSGLASLLGVTHDQDTASSPDLVLAGDPDRPGDPVRAVPRRLAGR